MPLGAWCPAGLERGLMGSSSPDFCGQGRISAKNLCCVTAFLAQKPIMWLAQCVCAFPCTRLARYALYLVCWFCGLVPEALLKNGLCWLLGLLSALAKTRACEQDS